MIVCNITLNFNSVNFDKLIDKLDKIGSFILDNKDTNGHIYFASKKEEVDEKYMRRILNSCKIDFLFYQYKLGEELDYTSYINQWISERLDEQYKLNYEKNNQEEMQKMQRRIVLLDRLADELIAYNEANVKNKEKNQNIQEEGQQEQEEIDQKNNN